MKRRGEREGVEKDIEESDEEGVGADQDGKWMYQPSGNEKQRRESTCFSLQLVIVETNGHSRV